MMKIFLVLFISFAYAAKFPESRNENIEKVFTSGLDQLDFDTFYCVMTFLSAEEALSLKILSKRIHCKVKKLWPKMNLSTIVEGFYSGRPVDFSHIVKIRDMNMDESKDQVFFYNQAQLSCLREFSLECRNIHNLQAVIDLLPKNSLTSLKLQIIGPPYPFINKLDFPKLTHLELRGAISLNRATFNYLSNFMRVFGVENIYVDIITLSSLVAALVTMDKLEVLSFRGCTFFKDGFSTILRNLPASLKSLDICNIKLLNSDVKFSETGFEGLKEMKCLQEIDFLWVGNELAIEIISNLPNCIADIACHMERETLNVFQQRLGEFTNVKRINLPWAYTELFPVIRKIFPNLDEDIKRELDVDTRKELYEYGL